MVLARRLFSALVAVYAVAVVHSLQPVRSLPGTSAKHLNGHSSGYVRVTLPSGQALNIFCYHVQHVDPSKPLLVWMNGGPGASSLMGLFTEVGPLLLNGRSLPADGRTSNTTAADWQLFPNLHGWHHEASLLVWEQPAGVGFSHCSDRHACPVWDDASSAEANLHLLLAFFAEFPSERGRQLFIAGESYGGVYVPLLARRILEHNERSSEADALPLQGLAIGNGCLGFEEFGGCGRDTLGLLLEYFETSTADVSTDAARQACGDQLYQGLGPTNFTRPCQVAMKRLFEDIGAFNVYQADGPCGPDETGNWGSGDAYSCGSSGAIRSYMAAMEVQKALHAIPPGATEAVNWQMWDGDSPFYNITAATMLPHYAHVLAAGVPVLIYNGLRDTALPYIGARQWTAKIGGSVSEPRRLWSAGGVVAGHVVRFATGLEFATVEGAGHLVPGDRPLPARVMISSFLSGRPLPEYAGPKCSKIWMGRGWANFCDVAGEVEETLRI